MRNHLINMGVNSPLELKHHETILHKTRRNMLSKGRSYCRNDTKRRNGKGIIRSQGRK